MKFRGPGQERLLARAEGTPHQCPLCGAISNLEPAFPGGDAICAACGCDRYCERLAGMLESLSLDGTWYELGLDSLDFVEVVMELEEEFNLDIPHEDSNNSRRWPI